MFGAIVSGIVFGFCALIMIGIGVSQLKSKEPVGFYTGVKPPKAEELTDVKAWNTKHGQMFIIYGICLVLAWILGLFLNNDYLALIPYAGLTLVPLVIIILLHRKYVNTYYKDPTGKK